MTDFNRPRLVTLQETGSEATGYITIAEESSGLPFMPAAIEWLYTFPEFAADARPETTEHDTLLACLTGSVGIQVNNVNQPAANFTLNTPAQGLLLPKGTTYSLVAPPGAIVLKLLAS